MFGSLKLGRPFGIELHVHGTFWLLPLFVMFSGGGLLDVAVLLAVFGCVALHEVGHALAARFYGIDTHDITLYPVGGVARLERIPERPLQEIVIALAGPLVNVAIALALAAVVVLGSVALPVDSLLSPADPAAYLIGRVLLANVGLVLFNLIPAFPMDGGRVLRALLSIGLPRLDATRVAVTIGSVLAAVGVYVGLFGLDTDVIQLRGGNINLLLVSGLIFLLGQAELSGVRAQEARKRWRRQFGGLFEVPDSQGPRHPDDPFSGWRWDPARRVWSEWRGGVLVREVYQA